MHARSLHGNREICGLASAVAMPRSASGRRGAVADDARSTEVRLLHSSEEADERTERIRGGAGGAKGGGQGKHVQSSHAPDAVPGKCVDGAWSCTAPRGRSMRTISKPTSKTCMPGYSGARTEHGPRGVSTSLNPTGASVPSGLRHWRIRFFSAPEARY